jgi:type I restriction enzyme, S subunit
MAIVFSNGKLPRGWVMESIGSVVLLINGKSFKSEDWKTSGIPIIRIQNLNNSKAQFNFISDNQIVEAQYRVNSGDLLFAWSGTPGTSFGAHIWNGGKAYLNQHIFKVITFDGLDKKYFFYILNYLVNDFVAKSKGTAGLAHITKKELESTKFPLAPLCSY